MTPDRFDYPMAPKAPGYDVNEDCRGGWNELHDAACTFRHIMYRLSLPPEDWKELDADLAEMEE